MLEDLKRRVSVARVGGKLYAFDDLCPHEACPLSSGLCDSRAPQPVSGSRGWAYRSWLRF